MKTIFGNPTGALRPAPATRSLREAIAPFEQIARSSPNLLAKHLPRFDCAGEEYEIPRYLFIGPKGGAEPLRIGLFAAIHGDEPHGTGSLAQLIRVLEAEAGLAKDFCLFLYPICNPTGYEDGTRCSRRGRDLNREFWDNSTEPEVQQLERELYSHAFDGIITLHLAEGSRGVYGFVHGATLTRHLLEPALAAAAELLPRSAEPFVEGWHARHGIVRAQRQGGLSAPPKVRPKPFEIALKSPREAPVFVAERAMAMALVTILTEYRKLSAFAPNL